MKTPQLDDRNLNLVGSNNMHEVQSAAPIVFGDNTQRSYSSLSTAMNKLPKEIILDSHSAMNGVKVHTSKNNDSNQKAQQIKQQMFDEVGLFKETPDD